MAQERQREVVAQDLSRIGVEGKITPDRIADFLELQLGTRPDPDNVQVVSNQEVRSSNTSLRL